MSDLNTSRVNCNIDSIKTSLIYIWTKA